MAVSSKTRVLIVGASVGYAWNLPEWHMRQKNERFIIEMIPLYTFDKTEALREIFMRPKRIFKLTKTYFLGFFKPSPQKPELLIIKQCAAYFPRNLEDSKNHILRWLKDLRTAGILPGLATVVPVTEEHSKSHPGRLEGIIAYNNWIREIARQEGIYCLDLEKTLRISDQKRVLQKDFTSGDGLHLNSKAYTIMDRELERTLSLFFNL